MKKILTLIITLSFIISPVFSKKAKTVENPIPPSGYLGTLPDLTSGYKTSEPSEAPPIFDSVDNFDKLNDIKPTPQETPAFINIIQKKNKLSQYVNDLQEIIPILNQIEKLITINEDTQHFNAAANYLNENIVYLREKYRYKSESTYASFKRLMQLNMQIQTVASIRTEKAIYSPYLSSGQNGYLYGNNVINQQLEYLLTNIEETIIILKEAR